MDFESPDVEKDFPGLYASESGRKSNESDFSDGADHEKPSKKDLLGRRKEKKEKKDRGYAALEGESSPEEDTDTKSPSKSKKTKSFKFPTTSKSKEKREKSRDKEKVEETVKKELTEKEKKKEKEREKEREREKKEKEKREKLKEKDKEKEEKAKFKLESKEKLKDDKKDKGKDKDKEKIKEKDKDKVKEKEKDKERVKEKDKEKVKEKDKDKVKEKEKEKSKEKDKDKKDKKLTKVPSTVTSGVPFEEIFTLGVALPIFGVPLHQSVERLRCHDDTGLPLVIRDSIDYLQANGLKSPMIYRAEPDKIKLAQLRKLYTDRDAAFPYHWDVPVACAIMKCFLSELPESILTQELHAKFEQTTAMSEAARLAAAAALARELPDANRRLLGWLLRHFDEVMACQKENHITMPILASALCPALNMSQSLFTYLVTNAEKLFPDVRLTRYIPPWPTLPADFPESSVELAEELRKQESLLSQVHAEMHAGFTTPQRDQQLWEAQRIVTQLKRKLRALQKSVEPNAQPQQQASVDERQAEEENTRTESTVTVTNETEQKTEEIRKESPKPQEAVFDAEFEDNFDVEPATESAPEPIKPQLTETELKKLRLELENAEYLQLKSLLQAKINSEQFEIVKLRSQIALKNKLESSNNNKDSVEMDPQEELDLKQKLLKENSLLEQKRTALINQIFQERVACVQLKIELAMKELL